MEKEYVDVKAVVTISLYFTPERLEQLAAMARERMKTARLGDPLEFHLVQVFGPNDVRYDVRFIHSQ